jgi:hypothetical protein
VADPSRSPSSLHVIRQGRRSRGRNHSIANPAPVHIALQDGVLGLSTPDLLTFAQAVQRLPEFVSALLERHEQRRAVRRAVWREHTRAERAWHPAYERMAAAEASRDIGIDLNAGGLEL